MTSTCGMTMNVTVKGLLSILRSLHIMLAKLDSFFIMLRYSGSKPAIHHGLAASVTFF